MMKIDELIKEAYKAHDNVSLNAYRNIKSELQKVLTSKNAPEYSDKLFTQVVSKYGRRLEDAICQFRPGSELIKEYENELEVVKKLLPKPITKEDIIDFIENYKDFSKYDIGYIEEIDGTDYYHTKVKIPKKDMGKVIKTIKSELPTADGKMISEIIKTYII